MARLPRVVVPDHPHHVTQRGVRKMTTFHSGLDYGFYLGLLAELKVEFGVDVWAYCLMPNHVHLVLVPAEKCSLAKLLSHVHRRYTRRMNLKADCVGHLWQERFHSCVLDEKHLRSCVRYVEMNPVRANLCRTAWDWPWSSVHAHSAGRDNHVVNVNPMLGRVGDWRSYIGQSSSPEDMNLIRENLRTGRPVGNEEFLIEIEALTGLPLRKRRPGPKPVIK